MSGSQPRDEVYTEFLMTCKKRFQKDAPIGDIFILIFCPATSGIFLV